MSVCHLPTELIFHWELLAWELVSIQKEEPQEPEQVPQEELDRQCPKSEVGVRGLPLTKAAESASKKQERPSFLPYFL